MQRSSVGTCSVGTFRDNLQQERDVGPVGVDPPHEKEAGATPPPGTGKSPGGVCRQEEEQQDKAKLGRPQLG